MLSVENFLSLEKIEVSFAPLNVLVGPNGSGKTNLLKVFQFLGDVARQDLIPAIDEFGGMEQLLFRGEARKSATIKIALTGILTKHASAKAPDEYKISFRQPRLGPHSSIRRAIQRNEEIVLKRTAGRGRRITLSGSNMKVERIGDKTERTNRLAVQGSSAGLATLRRLGEEYGASQVEEWAQVFEQLRLFEIDVSRIRAPSRLRGRENLRPDAANLAAFLEWLHDEHPDAFEGICADVSFVLPGFRGFLFSKVGGSDDAIRVDIKEAGLLGATPLARASFGTIRAIALFAMLHDPNPPKLTCLEEIDHGLHPHALDRLVDRLREASKATQIIMATHSPALVNRLDLSELIILERDQNSGATRVVDLLKSRVDDLVKETGLELGELWFTGTIGGSL